MSILGVIVIGLVFVGFLLAVTIGRSAHRANRRVMSTGDSSFVTWSDGGSGSDCSPGDAGCGDGGGGGGDGGGGD